MKPLPLITCCFLFLSCTENLKKVVREKLAEVPSDYEEKQVNVSDRCTIMLPEFMKENKMLSGVASLKYANALKELYIIVIDEDKESVEESFWDSYLMDEDSVLLDTYTNFVRANFETAIETGGLTPSKPTRINGIQGNTFEINGTVSNIDLFYLIGVMESTSRLYQVIIWTLGGQKEEYIPVMQKIMRSMKEQEEEEIL